MANLNEQIAGIWDEWESQTPDDANNPDDFIDWAVQNGKMAPRPEDLRKIYRRQVSTALRQVYRTDEEGNTYRAKQCVTTTEEGKQLTLWFDVDKKGTARLRQKAIKQRREGIANDVFRAVSDVAHMNHAYPNDEPIQFEMDFTEDYEERKALERYEQEQKEAG
jgi:hypothetical protein